MNYIKQVAAMLGVEIGEEFKVRLTETPVIVNSEVFVMREYGVETDDGILRVDILNGLLTGRWEIVKLPWKPRRLEGYCYIDRDGLVRQTNWDGMLFDLAMYKLGKIYQTHQEAEAHAEEDKAYWGEIWKELEE